jgi:MFS family permease
MPSPQRRTPEVGPETGRVPSSGDQPHPNRWRALAPNEHLLVVARLPQGAAAGFQTPQNTGLIQQMFTGAERGRAFGIFGTTVGVFVRSQIDVVGAVLLGAALLAVAFRVPLSAGAALGTAVSTAIACAIACTALAWLMAVRELRIRPALAGASPDDRDLQRLHE